MKPVYKARCHKDRSWKTGFYLIKKRQIVIKDEKNIWPVHEQTVCQSTGYLDCNKKEIFIDDLVNFSTTINDNEIKLDKAQVMFDNLNGNLVLVEGEEVIGFVNEDYENPHYEVIGNVWDSVALPKKK
jgi:yopX protein